MTRKNTITYRNLTHLSPYITNIANWKFFWLGACIRKICWNNGSSFFSVTLLPSPRSPFPILFEGHEACQISAFRRIGKTESERRAERREGAGGWDRLAFTCRKSYDWCHMVQCCRGIICTRTHCTHSLTTTVLNARCNNSICKPMYRLQLGTVNVYRRIYSSLEGNVSLARSSKYDLLKKKDIRLSPCRASITFSLHTMRDGALRVCASRA